MSATEIAGWFGFACFLLALLLLGAWFRGNFYRDLADYFEKSGDRAWDAVMRWHNAERKPRPSKPARGAGKRRKS